MTGKQLKNSILQLAIQGKLVPQDPHDEPASELLKRIRKEKEQLVKTGKLKKKDLESTPIAEDEKPFEIPETWEICRVKDILLKITDGTHHSPINTETGDFKYITAKNIKENGISLANISYVSKEVHEEIFSRCNPSLGDILYIKDGATTGVCCINQLEEEFSMLSSVALLKPSLNLYTPFLLYCLRSPICYDSVRESMKGTGITRITLTKIEQWIIPLPPLSEQHRIVEKIEELMPLVEEYDKAQSELDKLNESLPEQLKKSILQQAIMGKLVPQDPNDEPASELLKRIHKEKENLVKSGALKKKDLITTPISDDEKPFDIPESWEWCYLGDLVSNRAGLAYSKDDLQIKKDKMVRVLRGGNIYYGSWRIEENDVLISSEFVNPDLYLKHGTFITPAVTSLENMGKTALIEKDYDNIVVGGFVLMLESFYKQNSFLKYLLYFFMTAYYKEICKSITNKSGQAFYNLSRKKMMEIQVPLPPLSEQHRIVAKIEELFSILK